MIIDYDRQRYINSLTSYLSDRGYTMELSEDINIIEFTITLSGKSSILTLSLKLLRDRYGFPYSIDGHEKLGKLIIILVNRDNTLAS